MRFFAKGETYAAADGIWTACVAISVVRSWPGANLAFIHHRRARDKTKPRERPYKFLLIGGHNPMSGLKRTDVDPLNPRGVNMQARMMAAAEICTLYL